jgi:hypothetical protein
MTWVDALVATVFGVWLVLSIAYQFGNERLDRWVERLAVVAIVPKWNFFAPTPGVVNYHLLYRDVLHGGSVGSWSEVVEAEPRDLGAALWNPGKRRAKALFDLTVSLAEVVERLDESEEDLIRVSTPYLALLVYVSSLPASAFTATRQFAIVQTSYGDDDVRPVFVSDVHRL